MVLLPEPLGEVCFAVTALTSSLALCVVGDCRSRVCELLLGHPDNAMLCFTVPGLSLLS